MGPDDTAEASEHTIPEPLPPREIAQYLINTDPHLETDISEYFELEVPDETVLLVEKIKQEIVAGEAYEIWDVTTDKGRWWVITNLTNKYSQHHFPSLDYVLTFHVGLMMRVKSRSVGADADEPHPFDEVFRRKQQAEERHDSAVEAVDYQAVGMQLRESLISLIGAMRRRVDIAEGTDPPKSADFVSWSQILINELCSGSGNQKLRMYLRTMAKETWQLVSWLTHDNDADRTASSIAIHACNTTVGHFAQLLERSSTGGIQHCPICKSRQIRTHFDPQFLPDGEYYLSCGACEWNDHPARI